jgi:hypothetical protein
MDKFQRKKLGRGSQEIDRDVQMVEEMWRLILEG